jgi:hypothetical protein
MKQEFVIVGGIFVYIFIQSTSAYEYVSIDDGKEHVISDTRYRDSIVYLDPKVIYNPGTFFHLVDGGEVYDILPSNNSSVRVSGGIVDDAIWADDHSQVDIRGGTIFRMRIGGESTAFIVGGSFLNNIRATDQGTIDILGGTIGDLMADSFGTIFLHGKDFRIGNTVLNIGDHLRKYGVIGGPNYGFLTGVITGTLFDGSTLSSSFEVSLPDPNADIIVIPEPATIGLLAFGGLLIRRRRKSGGGWEWGCEGGSGRSGDPFGERGGKNKIKDQK